MDDDSDRFNRVAEKSKIKIVFFDVKEWELPLIEALSCHKNIKVISYDSPVDIKKIPPDTKVISTSRLHPRIDKHIIDSAKDLKLIVTRTSGIDHIDINYAASRGVFVKNAPDYSSIAAAEYTFCLILALVRKLNIVFSNLSRGDFKRESLTGNELFGKTIGIVGTGRIGSRVASMAHGFGMNLLCFSRSIKDELKTNLKAQYVKFDELLKNSDVITLHLPYNHETHHIINSNNIKIIKKGAYLINTSRGGLVCLKTLYRALKEGILAGAALDTFEGEENLLNKVSPYEKEDIIHEILQMPNVIISPHNAFNSYESQTRLIKTTVDNIISFLKDQP